MTDLAFTNVATPDDSVSWRAKTDAREQVITRYTKGTGQFSPDKKYIALTMTMFHIDDREDGYHEGVWEAQFKTPEELLLRPQNPVGTWNEPQGPVEAAPIVAQTKGIWVFGDGSSITAVGPALSHLVPLNDGSFLFLVSCAQTITNGTGRFEGAGGLKTSLGSTHVRQNLFGPGDVSFEAQTVDTFRVMPGEFIAGKL